MTGGAEKRIHEIGRRLAADDHEITIYGRHFWEGPRRTTHDGMTLHAVAPERELYSDEGQRSITEAIDFGARLLPTLRRRIDEHDVIVASVFPYFPVLSSALSRIGSDIPLVTTWHEVWCEYWEEYLGSLAIGGKVIERLTARLPQYPIAVSGVTEDRLASIGRDPERVRTIPNGIDYDQITGTAPATEEFEVLFAGRLIEDKRVDVLLSAFDQVADTYGADLGIIGDGPEFESLKDQAAALDNRDNVHFLGFLDDYEDVLAHMRAAEVFASPSTREGFGITYAEAMAAGCTVIGADHPDSAADEVLRDGGFLVEPSVDDLATVLGDALAGETPPREPTDVAKRFDWDNVADQATSAYSDAIRGQW